MFKLDAEKLDPQSETRRPGKDPDQPKRRQTDQPSLLNPQISALMLLGNFDLLDLSSQELRRAFVSEFL